MTFTSARMVPGLLGLSVMTATSSGILFAQTNSGPPALRPASNKTRPDGPAKRSGLSTANPEETKQPAVPASQPTTGQENARSQMEASIALQLESVRKQTGSKGPGSFFTVDWARPDGNAPAQAPDCIPLPEAESEPMIKDAAAAQKLDPALIRAVIRQESGFRPCALSPKGAMGLMQLMPETAQHYNLADPFNAADNIKAGARFLKQLMERFHGNLKLTLAAYNAGPGKVEGEPVETLAVPETQSYVDQILKAVAQEPLNPQGKAE